MVYDRIDRNVILTGGQKRQTATRSDRGHPSPGKSTLHCCDPQGIVLLAELRFLRLTIARAPYFNQRETTRWRILLMILSTTCAITAHGMLWPSPDILYGSHATSGGAIQLRRQENIGGIQGGRLLPSQHRRGPIEWSHSGTLLSGQ
jgi:hypothetical protein